MDKKELLRTVKFLLFSVSAGVIQIVSFAVFEEFFHFAHWLSYLLALVLSVIWNFTFNRKFTFKSATNVPVAMLKVALFYCVFTPVSLYLGQLAENAGVNNYIVEAVTMSCNLVTEYLFCRFVVYRGSMNTNNLAKKDEAKAETK